ncbi:MAG: DUF2334 domain-containing protein [bacterium]
MFLKTFCIRDDDISYWTTPASLKNIYEPLWRDGIPVSLAVIPYSVKSYNQWDREFFYQEMDAKPIRDNKELVEMLKYYTEKKLVEIMMHGYNHIYKVSMSKRESSLVPADKKYLDEIRAQKKNKKLYWVGEYRWGTYKELSYKTKQGKEYLESVFGTKITVFVPPSNQLSTNGARAVIETGMNISGIINLNKDRSFNYAYVKNWFKRWIYRLIHGIPYPYPLNFGTHSELVAHAFTHLVDIKAFKKLIDQTPEDAPFVLATHYWELLQYPELLRSFYDIIDYVQKNGAVIRLLGDVIS